MNLWWNGGFWVAQNYFFKYFMIYIVILIQNIPQFYCTYTPWNLETLPFIKFLIYPWEIVIYEILKYGN